MIWAVRIMGGLLIVAGVFLPREWYDRLPKRTELPDPPIGGVTLLQLSLVVEGALALLLSFGRWTFNRAAVADRLHTGLAPAPDDVPDTPRHLVSLALVTLLGLILRLVRVESDLWLDEITPILDYGRLSPLQVLGSYLSTNNHVLNTLLVNGSIAVFGHTEWAIRLPAVLFGTATIPLVYWLARQLMGRTASVGAALLTSVSYHMVFFSQNARGYSAYVFFSVLSTGLLVRALREDRLHLWIWFVVATVLNFASVLIASFVLAAHAFVSALSLLAIRGQRGWPRTLTHHAVIAFSAAAFLTFQLYSLILPKALVTQQIYRRAATGFAPFSMEFVGELQRGITAGLAGGGQAFVLPVLACGTGLVIAGLWVLLQRNWPLVLGLALPLVVTFTFVVVRGFTASPRFFLLGLPLVFLALPQGLLSLAQRMTRFREPLSTRLAFGTVLVAAAASAASLPRYYSTPKQAYREAIGFVEAQRRRDDVAIVIYTAEKGVWYYGARMGIDMSSSGGYHFVRTREALDRVLAEHANKRVYVVTTFQRALRLDLPEIDDRVRAGWRPARIFPATVGDGQLVVWMQRE